ncbi:MAG: succinate dehydrogenase, hydrophobic membrane anchor protein [Alphaproteobacteria bacterium]|nr:succinate dehydrogenase, hydrophobic membrane anchor protein [Alphaproteobacteria bacterium]MCY4608590.1 succinate dehydrogenase, hydrophobic membrane anchor protein [bacterium]
MANLKRGSLHWRRQHLAALALIPLILVFIGLLPVLATADHEAVVGLMGTVIVPVFLAALLGVGLWHMKLGLETIIDDYAGRGSCGSALRVLVATASVALAAVAVVSLVMLVVG